ncbi:MAG: NAD-dependent epimerase/dehydratase family protein [bacterium]|nr:NAD-dependent epimerase/dehydratase family protein [bacterium]
MPGSLKKEKNMKGTVLVTGASGMIGSAMVDSLRNQGYKVIAFDLNKGNSTASYFFQGSVLEKRSIAEAIKGCDYVFHLAAVLGVANSNEQALLSLDVNTLGVRNVLEACVNEGVKKVVFSSSSEVYGEPEKMPISETDQLAPKSEYGKAKALAEEYVKAFNKQYGLDYSIVRFFNVYGPNQVAKFVMPLFVDGAIAKRALTINGDGSQIRAFCYVDNAVAGAQLAMFKDEGDGQIFNIGNSGPISMKDLANLVNEIAGNPVEPKFIPFEESDRSKEREIFARIPDISKAEKVLGYVPKVSLREGIQRVIEFRKSAVKV